MAAPFGIAYAAINLSSTTALEAVAGKASHYTRVIGAFLMSAADATVTIQSSSGAALIGPCAVGATSGFVLTPSMIGYCQSAISGGSIYIQNSTASQLGGVLITVQEGAT